MKRPWTLTPYLAASLAICGGVGVVLGLVTGRLLPCVAIGTGVGILVALAVARWRFESVGRGSGRRPSDDPAA